MRDQITGRLQALQRTFASFSAGQKTTAVIGGLALVLAAFLVFRWASTPTYAPLFTNLAPADASAVIDKLDAQGTPYQITGGGNTIMVPQADVYDARIQLSGAGLPSQSSEGYGLLDKQGLSTSQFQEQTTYKRAIEGELDKTIEALDSVDTAVVHVAMPEEKLFQTDTAPTTASVLVAVHPGATLDTSQVQAIVHLVASSVSGLDPKNVTVTDSAGNVLSTGGDTIDTVADTRAQQVQAFQDQTKARVGSLLDRVLGPNNSSVEVTADLNFDQTTTHTTRYFANPNAVPLSVAKSTEKYTAPGGANAASGGVVGPDGQLLTTGTGSTGPTKYIKKNETADNSVGQVVEQRTAAPGNVASLHVAVVLDSATVAGKNPVQIQQLIANGLGIDPKRGDTVSVMSMPFDRTAETTAAKELAAATAADQQAQYLSMGKTAGLVILVGLILFLAWRRAKKRDAMRQQATTYVVEQLRRTQEPIEASPVLSPAELVASETAELRMAARDEIAALVEKQPEEVAQLLRGWLVEAGR
ncbi:MAG: flagellar basal-body MS-ring/collar protein FliF [Nocardioides sp.]